MPLLKSVIKPLGLLVRTVASAAIDVGVQKKIYGSGKTTLVISNKEMDDTMKIAQALENSGFLLKVVKTSVLGDLLTKKLSGKGTVSV